MTIALMTLMMTLAGSAAWAVPSIVEQVSDGVYVVRDEDGSSWGGWSMGVAHMNRSSYQAKKILDLSDVPEDVWNDAREVRLSMYMSVRDYSWHNDAQANGLDEAFEVIVNGKVHIYPTDCGAPVYKERARTFPHWYDIVLPTGEFKRGVNEIIIHRAESDKNDDYLYLGINNGPPRGNSAVTFDGKNWRQDELTVPGGNGEYMVRLYLIVKDLSFEAKWTPAATPPLDDPAGVILYAGAHEARPVGDGVQLAAGQSARIEWRAGALDQLNPVQVTVEADGPVSFAWLNEDGEPGKPVEGLVQTLEANRTRRTSGLVLTARDTATVRRVTLSAARDFHPAPRPIDMTPAITPCPPMGPLKPPSCEIQGATATLQGGGVRAVFNTDGRLRLTSLFNEYTKTEMLRSPDDVLLFMVQIGDRRYAGSRDFACEDIEPVENGFIATLTLAEPALRAELSARIDNEGLRLGLNLTNAGEKPVDFKLAFPHLAGLALSDEPANDYYFYPWGGGIIAKRPAIIRRGYGDHEALYQIMDIFSPAKGAGVYMRADDSEGWHKVLALRDYTPGRGEVKADRLSMKVREEFMPPDSLTQEVEGIAMAYEYQRRTRGPGGSFAPSDAVIAAHPGDWHVAMQRYSDWAHQVWKFRPYPSRLHNVRNMIAAGWGTGYLFRDGAYRTDIIKPRTDCIELMSWWDWSELGPFSTPMDKLDTVMTPAEIERWKGYFVNDPVTGKKMWNNAPDDYRGYNERFGGLPAFRKAIQTYRELGAKLVTLYTDPFRLHDACPTGRAHGKEWGVVGRDGKKTRAYLVWNPCHDLPEVREWVAETMGRVMRETGADGIRLDEYGHRGWACYDPNHHHTYAEWGITQWNKAVAETCRMVHEEMDKVRPDLVLTTEHPGYDYLMQYLEGCITYDLTVQASKLRPLECNIQRFYFRECKPYELDHRGADPRDRKKFWNAVESFGRYYPADYYTILDENEDTYWLGDAYPLLVTPGKADGVYVNRFSRGGKSLYHLYNATGHTFEGVALAVRMTDDQHLFDLIDCREAEAEMRDGLAWVSVYLPRNEVACIARLQRRMTVTRAGEKLTVEITGLQGECALAVADRDGNRLLERPARAGRNTLDLSGIEEDAAPACVKLLVGGQLVDVAEVVL
ncbi:MAG: hypothetical protein J7M38_08355 [Armatimonadetes bacterium]|nr:hypothetical protein [Armatimonadota bacterium]